MAKEYTQFDVDYMYTMMLTGDPLYTDTYEDCQRIKTVIKNNRNLILSTPASYKFWKTRSEWWDANWLLIHEGEKGDAEILEYWDEFIDGWYKNGND